MVFVSFGQHNFADLCGCSNRDMFEKQTYIASKRPQLNKKDFDALRTHVDMRNNPDGLMASVALQQDWQPSQAVTYDLQHSGFQTGVANLEIHYFMQPAHREIKLCYDDVRKVLDSGWS